MSTYEYNHSLLGRQLRRFQVKHGGCFMIEDLWAMEMWCPLEASNPSELDHPMTWFGDSPAFFDARSKWRRGLMHRYEIRGFARANVLQPGQTCVNPQDTLIDWDELWLLFIKKWKARVDAHAHAGQPLPVGTAAQPRGPASLPLQPAPPSQNASDSTVDGTTKKTSST